MLELKAFTDGACSGNPGPGGWGVVLQAINAGEIVKERELSGGAGETTNNQMELMAAISALENTIPRKYDHSGHRQFICQRRCQHMDSRVETKRVEDRREETC